MLQFKIKVRFLCVILVVFIITLYWIPVDDLLLKYLISLLVIFIIAVFYSVINCLVDKSYVKDIQIIKDDIERIINNDFNNVENMECAKLAHIYSTMLDNNKQVSSYLSHELKNKLSIILKMIESNEDKNDVIETISKTNSSIINLQALSINTNIHLNERIDLSLLCAEIVDEYSRKNPNISLEFDTVPYIYGKYFLLSSCISNLIDNAIKYGKGSKIEVVVKYQMESIKVSVKDYGQGIDEKLITDIFDLHNGLNLQTKNSYGVGLSIVKTTMNIMNGFVWVESEKNNYSKFVLSFPLD